MNRIVTESLVLVSIMSVGTLVAGARQAPAPPAAAAATTNAIGPKIQFAMPVYDFGRVRNGDPVKYTFVFTNTGDALLVINNVNPGCGCTTIGEWTKQVEPGKTGVIPIQFNTGGYNGAVQKRPTVTCNVTNQPTLVLLLQGTIFKPYDINPQMGVFNMGPDAGAASLVITITNNMEEPLLLSSPTVNNRIFSVELVTNQLGKGYQIKVSTVPPMPAAGSSQGQVVLKTSWTNTPTIAVPLAANIQAAVVVIPPVINLPPGPLPRAMTNSIAIQNNSVANGLSLSEPKVSVEGVGVEIRENQPGKSFTALLAFPQGFEVPAGQLIEVSFKTSNPKFPELKVPVRQMPRPAAPVVPAPHAAIVAPAPNFPLVPPTTPAVSAGKESTAAGSPPVPRPPLPPGL